MKTIKEVAKLYDVSENTIRKWIRDGMSHRVEKVIGIRPRIVLDIADISRYLQSKERSWEDIQKEKKSHGVD